MVWLFPLLHGSVKNFLNILIDMKTQTFKYEHYVTNIFYEQSEYSIYELIFEFARETGYEGLNLENIVELFRDFQKYDEWDEPYYDKETIRQMLQKIVN